MAVAGRRGDHPLVPYACPVCGYPELDDPPRSASGAGSLEICPSCGFQFGKSDDDDGWTYSAWRDRWIAEGMPWDRGSSPPPEGWDPRAQLRAVTYPPPDDPPQSSERGQTLVEYVAVLALVAALVGGVVKAAPAIASGVSSTWCTFIGGGCGAGAPGQTAAGGTAPGQTPPGGSAPGQAPPGGTGIGGIIGNAGGSPSNPLGQQVENAARNAQSLRDAGGNAWGRPNTLDRHFRDHGGDFGAGDPEDYAQRAQDFFQRAVRERLPTKVDPDGIIRVYDPATNEFGAYNPDGTTRTYFKPTRGQAYWDDQPGSDPWGEPGGGEPGGGEPGGGEPPAGEEPPAGGEPPAPEVSDVPDVPEVPEIPELPIPEIPIIP